MTTSGDHGPEMSLTWLLDDETSEAIMRCDEVDPRLEHLAAFAKHVRDLGDGPSPPASPALRAFIASGARPGRGATRSSRMLADEAIPAAGKLVSLGLAAKLGVGTAVAAVGMAGAAAAGVLPDRANDAVRHAVEAVTPVDFTEPADEHPTNFGDRVSKDATGASDGQPGVDGDLISDEAPGAARRPADPGEPVTKGLDRAGETPAASHLPDDVPASDAGESDGQPDRSPGAPPADPPSTPNSGGASGDHTPPTAPPGPPDARG
ncbi:MAG: hypothetical protein ACRD07_11310 [Acidimicrobiales bacterium]